MAEVERVTLKVTVPKWRVKLCLALLAPLRVLPSKPRDQVADWLGPHFARWIANGVQFR